MEVEKKNKKEKKVYRLIVLEEKKYEPVFNLKLTKVNTWFYFGGFFILIMTIAFLIWRYTPMKRLLPRYEDLTLKNQVLENMILIDSLKKELSYMDLYFRKLSYLATGKNIDSIAGLDSSDISNRLLTAEEYDSILNLLKNTPKNLEDLNLTTEERDEVSDIKFVKPVSGVVSNNFNPAQGHYGIDIVAQENTPVQAVLPGTVILATWTVNTGYVIEIQHSNNMISVYKHNSELLKKEGDKVKAGEAIALIGKTGELSTGPHLHFELWYNGKPVNPADYIVF